MYFDYEEKTINFGSITNSLMRPPMKAKEFFIPNALTLILILTLISLALLGGVVILYLRDKNRDSAAATDHDAAEGGKKLTPQ
jgi:hypothetical protein